MDKFSTWGPKTTESTSVPAELKSKTYSPAPLRENPRWIPCPVPESA